MTSGEASMERDDRFWETLRAEAAARRRAGEAPSPDEVLAFVEGRLEGAERERVADGIAAFPAAARLARDLARFPDVAADRQPGPLSAADAADLWRRIDPRLEEARSGAGPDARPAEEPGAPVRSAPAPPPAAPRRSRVPWWAAAAAVLLGAVLGVAGQRLADRDLPQPNPEIRTLTPRGEGTTRGGAAQRPPTPRDPVRLVLILEFAGAAEGELYRLVLRDRAGRELWATGDLRREADGSFALAIPRGFLGAGEYTLELHRPGDRAAPPLAVYDLDLRRRANR
jgi:hypothetical protein